MTDAERKAEYYRRRAAELWAKPDKDQSDWQELKEIRIWFWLMKAE